MKKLSHLLHFLPILCLLGCAESNPVNFGYFTDPAIPPTQDEIPRLITIDARDDISNSDLNQLAEDYGLDLQLTGLFSQTKEVVAEVPEELEEILLNQLNHDSRVEFAEPVHVVRAYMVPNDPMFKDQWNMAKVQAPLAWDYASGRGITVAVVDTGVACFNDGQSYKVSDLKNTDCVPGFNFVSNSANAHDDHGHGTHVAGTIAQSTNNNLGVAGLAYNAKIMPVKVLSAHGGGTDVSVADGIRWAADHGANVINLSLGSDFPSKVIAKAVQHARNKNVVVVAAAGNSGGKVGYPGADKGVIGVSATDSNDEIAKFSCRGKDIDLAAPGVAVTQQTICDNGENHCEEFATWNGTSMASPHVAGVAALVTSLGVSDSNKVEQYLRDSADKIDDSPSGRLLYGSGRVNAGAAVRSVTLTHWLYRALALAAVFGYLSFRLSKEKKFLSPWDWKVVVPALCSSVGLVAFLPLVYNRGHLALELLSSPLLDWALMAGTYWYGVACLGAVGVVFGLTLTCFGLAKVRHAVAGLGLGFTAYLASAVALGEVAGPFSATMMRVLMGLGAAVTFWLTRQNLIQDFKVPEVQTEETEL